jgi:3-hydroxyisobutyrate dehydrogenase-like beta-hydroxyacid dehydrogenase
MTKTHVSVLGLGAMGSALAKALVAAGHETTVWNRSAGKELPGAHVTTTAGEAVRASPVVVA